MSELQLDQIDSTRNGGFGAGFAAGIALVITLVTISFQAFKEALTNGELGIRVFHAFVDPR